jgi:hypothetical protein
MKGCQPLQFLIQKPGSQKEKVLPGASQFLGGLGVARASRPWLEFGGDVPPVDFAKRRKVAERPLTLAVGL